MIYPEIRMVLFFTRNIRLADWHRVGSTKREVAIYQKLRDYNVHTEFITYGQRDDARLASEIIDIPVHVNYLSVKPRRYERWLSYLHALPLRRADVYKTNQTNGADIALAAAKQWHKPLIARFGYMHSFNIGKQHGEESNVAQTARQLEADVFSQAQAVIGTTERLTNDVQERFPSADVYTVPNYVETDHFAPMDIPKQVDVTYVGRLHPEKNVEALLDALVDTPYTCRIIGDGQQAKMFRDKYSPFQDRISFLGQISNADLPRYLNESRIFIMPSLYEGHPKAVIEAMSSGCAVIGTDVVGTREVIDHAHNGWLCETSPESIRESIQHLMSDEAQRHQLGKNARQYVLDNYDLDHIAETEYQVIRQVVEQAQYKK
ncbi:MAG: glycosyltransferase family 4 protein [Chloroflexota bacterium]